MPRGGRLHARAWGLGAAALLLLPLAAPAAPPTLEGRLVDASGDPVAGAAVLLHHAGSQATTRADGAFRLPRGDGPDVLVVARRDAAQSFHHVPAGASAVQVALPPYEPSTSRVEAYVRAVTIPAAISTFDLGPGEPQPEPFVVDAGARAASVRIEWPPATSPAGRFTVQARAESKDGRAFAQASGNDTFDLVIPGVLLRERPGDWMLTVDAVDALAPELRVNATFRIEYGPLEMKRVEGRGPQVVDAPGPDDPTAPEWMDVLGVEVTNETPTEFEIHVHLAQAGGASPTTGHAYWVAGWRHGGVAYEAQARVTAGQTDDATRFSVGPCVRTCDAAKPVHGEVVWGAPGLLRFVIPKTDVGSPPDGANLTDLHAYAYESAENLPLYLQEARRARVLDMTPKGGPYVMGAREYAAPPDAVDALLAPADAGPLLPAALRDRAAGGGALPWLALLAVAGGGAGVAVWARARASSPYVVQRTLGKGAHGRVVLARHRVLHHLVAIKETWHPDDRILHEARTLARLNHPNVVRVFDVREQDGRLSIVMEYVAGGTLEARLASGEPVPLPEAARVWRDVLRGLEAAHALDIVHRDVKPANVLLTPEGDAKLCDFGLARSPADATLPGDGSGGLAGTPSYMSPEQVRGEAPTPASDVFAAAALAYRLLSGRPIADASGCRTPWDVLLARQASPPALPLENAPPEANALLAACLHEDPASRPTATEALAALDALTAAARR